MKLTLPTKLDDIDGMLGVATVQERLLLLNFQHSLGDLAINQGRLPSELWLLFTVVHK